MKQGKLFEEEGKTVPIKTGLSLAVALDVFNRVKTMIGSHCNRIDAVGSLRRGKLTVNDIDILVETEETSWRIIKQGMMSYFKCKIDCSGDSILRTLLPVESLRESDAFKVVAENPEFYIQVDFYRAYHYNYGIHKLIRTGSAEHNIFLAKQAIKKGMKLQYSQGVMERGVCIAGKTEEDVFKALGLNWIEPKLREVKGGKPVWQ